MSRAVWPMSARPAWSATRNETSGELKKKWYVHPATPRYSSIDSWSDLMAVTFQALGVKTNL